MREPARIALDDETRRSLHEELLAVPSPYERLEDALVELYRCHARLPRQLLARLAEFANSPAAPGMLVVENCPIDPDVPATPANSRRSPRKRTFVSEGCLLGFAQIIGKPLGYRNEKDGELIQNVCPVQTESTQTSSESSEIRLGFHTDFDFAESRPFGPYNDTNADYIVLYCLRSDPHAEAFTIYADARDICARLTSVQITTLRQPLYQFGASYSFTGRSGDSRIWSEAIPVLKGPEEYPEVSIDMLCGVRGLSDAATGALRAVAEVCGSDDVAQAVCLRAGQVLLIDNRKGAHARTAFRARYDGTDRWLQRVYARRSLWELRRSVAHPARIF
jgi:L-asparagine oxygenase